MVTLDYTFERRMEIQQEETRKAVEDTKAETKAEAARKISLKFNISLEEAMKILNENE